MPPFCRPADERGSRPSLHSPESRRHVAASTGVGKTHLACAIGRQAILTGYTVLFIAAPTLVAQLAKAHSEGRLEERLAFFAKGVIVDELGYLPFEPDAAHLFFQLVSRRYERGSMLITSNRSVAEWGTVFGDPVVATAILDRLLPTATLLQSVATATACARSGDRDRSRLQRQRQR